MRILLIFLFFPLMIYTQTVERGGFSPVSKGSYSNIVYSDLEGIQGHKYLFDSWCNGTIIVNDTIRSFQPKIQFDLVSGEIILGSEKLGNKGFIILDDSVTGLVIKNNEEEFQYVKKEKHHFLDSQIDRKYFVNPFAGIHDLLLIDYRKILSEPSAIQSNYTSTSNDKQYKKKTIYYLMAKDKKYVKVNSLKKKQLLSVLSDKKEEIKKYISQHNLKLKDEKDVVKVLTYYHSI